MAFSEVDKVQIRKYLGFSRQYSQIFTELESAITQVQAVADGGSFPNSEGVPSPTEVEVKSAVADLQTLDGLMKSQWKLLAALTMDEVKVDVVRATYTLRSEGRRLVTHLSSLLNIGVRKDIYSSSPTHDSNPMGRTPWTDGGDF